MTTRGLASPTLVSPEDQSATFVELFFDLVFVFSVTQIVGLLHGGITWGAVGQAVLVFWLVWWAWTQFTWTLNAADTTHHWVQAATLVATAVAFFMAVALPDAFHGRAPWFAIPYVLVRAIGLGLYAKVAATNPAQRAAVRVFSLVSLGGLVAVLVGAFAGGTTQYLFWGLAIFLDVVAAAVGGQQEGWDVHPEHFGERHGLFVIIALGETLIVAAGGVTGAAWTRGVLVVGVLAVAISCGLWWVYFTRAKPALDEALTTSIGSERSTMARDVFSLAHFPMLCGVIAYAVAVEHAVAHPGDPLGLEPRLALAASLVLFVGGMVVAQWRARRYVLVPRLVLTLVTAGAVVFVGSVQAPWTLAMALAGILLIAVLERPAR